MAIKWSGKFQNSKRSRSFRKTRSPRGNAVPNGNEIMISNSNPITRYIMSLVPQRGFRNGQLFSRNSLRLEWCGFGASTGVSVRSRGRGGSGPKIFFRVTLARYAVCRSPTSFGPVLWNSSTRFRMTAHRTTPVIIVNLRIIIVVRCYYMPRTSSGACTRTCLRRTQLVRHSVTGNGRLKALRRIDPPGYTKHRVLGP